MRSPNDNIVVVGPNLNVYYIPKHCDNVSLCGDGENDVTNDKITEALSQAQEGTHIHYWAHGCAIPTKTE
jgi:hypothetical protein